MNTINLKVALDDERQPAGPHEARIELSDVADAGPFGEAIRAAFEIEILRGAKQVKSGGVVYHFQLDGEKAEKLRQVCYTRAFPASKNQCPMSTPSTPLSGEAAAKPLTETHLEDIAANRELARCVNMDVYAFKAINLPQLLQDSADLHAEVSRLTTENEALRRLSPDTVREVLKELHDDSNGLPAKMKVNRAAARLGITLND